MENEKLLRNNDDCWSYFAFVYSDSVKIYKHKDFPRLEKHVYDDKVTYLDYPIIKMVLETTIGEQSWVTPEERGIFINGMDRISLSAYREFHPVKFPYKPVTGPVKVYIEGFIDSKTLWVYGHVSDICHKEKVNGVSSYDRWHVDCYMKTNSNSTKIIDEEEYKNACKESRRGNVAYEQR